MLNDEFILCEQTRDSGVMPDMSNPDNDPLLWFVCITSSNALANLEYKEFKSERKAKRYASALCKKHNRRSYVLKHLFQISPETINI